MEHLDIEEERFFAAIQKEDDLGVVLRVHLSLEQILNLIIENAFQNPAELEESKLQFSHKISVANGLGLVGELAPSLRRLNRIRNEFAHFTDYKIDHQTVNSFYNSFPKNLRDYIDAFLLKNKEEKARQKFLACCLHLHAALSGICEGHYLSKVEVNDDEETKEESPKKS